MGEVILYIHRIDGKESYRLLKDGNDILLMLPDEVDIIINETIKTRLLNESERESLLNVKKFIPDNFFEVCEKINNEMRLGYNQRDYIQLWSNLVYRKIKRVV